MYRNNVTVTQAFGLPTYMLSANNWYDLDPNVGGHYPHFFNFWSTLYSRYIPTSAVLSVRFTNTTADSLKCVVIPVYGTSIQYTNVDSVDEAPRR